MLMGQTRKTGKITKVRERRTGQEVARVSEAVENGEVAESDEEGVSGAEGENEIVSGHGGRVDSRQEICNCEE